jgi:hypothetical protein
MNWKPVVWGVIVLWLGAVLDFGAAPYLSIKGGLFAFTLTFAYLIAAYSRPAAGALVGFFAGVISGGLAGGGLAVHIISAVVIGFMVSKVARQPEELAALPTAGMIGAALFMTSLIRVFILPAGSIGAYLIAAGLSALMSVLLAFAVYPLARTLFQPKEA